MNKIGTWLIVLALLFGLSPAAFAGQQAPDAQSETASEYVVVYAEGVSAAAARTAIQAAGGTLVKETLAVGMATVTTRNKNFAAAARQQSALEGVARNRPIGNTEPNKQFKRDAVEKLPAAMGNAAGQGPVERSTGQAGVDSLATLQWDMAMIRATASGSYKVQAGDKRVLVGIIDSGIDGSHPDIAPNFNKALSRNFVTDIPAIDGPCEDPSDCVDPVDVDDSGHGTHVAGTVAAALNGRGVAGVAPNVTLVNVRGGQDSGYLFLQPVVDALVYSGDIGIDVVNMSFYIDPWLFNCINNPADSPEAQAEQRTILIATQRALNYARQRGVTLVASAGNGALDLGDPPTDESSPDYPPDTAYPREIDNETCRIMPVEGEGVIPVSALGPSTRKAYYSNYGVEQIVVSAPGGDYYDDTPGPANMILSTYPKNVLLAEGEIDENGNVLSRFVVKECVGNDCAYYRYLQGTSMAAPHATGVVALIVSQYGQKDSKHAGGLTLNPVQAEKILTRTATNTACPEPRLFDYPDPIPASYNAYCEGSPDFNGFYGEGIVDALAAVSGNRSAR